LRDALQATAMMETARQAGQYFDGELQIFKGINERCSLKFLKNCCKKGAGAKAQSNASVMTQLGFAATAYFGSEAYVRFSPYVFDFMYNNSIFSDYAFAGLESALTQQAAAANFTKLGSFYGVTAWSGASTVAPGFMHGMNLPGVGQITNTITSQFSVGGFNFGFDPYSLMFAVAIQVLTQLLTCDKLDIATNMHRESRLCTYVGEYCSRKIPIIGVCIERKKSYCCYNSRLARIISEQGRPLLGKSYGSPNGPNCEGFTADEFSRLDFSRMDLSEFYSEILPADFPAMSGAFGAHGARRVNEMSR
jgi:conjugal transfer mating pair stabilization protein TraN